MRIPLARALPALVLPLLLASCFGAQETDIQQAEALLELGDALNDVRTQIGDMQSQMDSLRLVVAKQDTIIRQLANLAGVPTP
jgi:hypothetical protein